MDPNFKKFKFCFDKEEHSQKSRQCNIPSCWECQGKDPSSKEDIEKIKAINRIKKPKSFNPNAPEKYCPNKHCSYCRRIKGYIEKRKKRVLFAKRIRGKRRKN